MCKFTCLLSMKSGNPQLTFQAVGNLSAVKLGAGGTKKVGSICHIQGGSSF